MLDSELLSHLQSISKERSIARRAYPVHLTLYERIKHVAACLLLSHQAKYIPVRLQSASSIQSILSFAYQPIEENVEYIDCNGFESVHRIFLRECAVSVRINYYSQLLTGRNRFLLEPKTLDPALQVFGAVSIDSLSQGQSVKVALLLLVIFGRLFDYLLTVSSRSHDLAQRTD